MRPSPRKLGDDTLLFLSDDEALVLLVSPLDRSVDRASLLLPRRRRIREVVQGRLLGDAQVGTLQERLELFLVGKVVALGLAWEYVDRAHEDQHPDRTAARHHPP